MSYQVAKPGSLVKPCRKSEQAQALRIREDGEDQTALEQVKKRPLIVPFDLRACGFNQLAVLHAGRTGRHTRHAAEAFVEMANVAVGHPRLAFRPQLHEIDATAR